MSFLLLYKIKFMDKESINKQVVESIKGLAIQDMTVEMTALIRSGAIPVGTKLPAVRALAEELGVSPASISIVWNSLKKSGLIESAGRNGVWVSGSDPSPRPKRFENVGNFGNKTKVDLTYSGPDPALLPAMQDALCYASKTPNIHSYERQTITPELKQAVVDHWPYQAQAFMATNGGFDGLQAVLSALVQPGTWLAVEEPTTARVLDIIEHLGIRAVPVECDDQGPMFESLQHAMTEKKLSGFLFQPRTHSVLGVSMSEQRMRELEPLIAEIPLIIEDDGIGPISESPQLSFGSIFADKVVHLRSYSKALGPDFRLAVLSTTKEYIDSIQAYRNFGASWTSRILQNAAAYLLNRPEYKDYIRSTCKEYAQRRRWLGDALTERGVGYIGNEGLSLWIPVPSEQYALVTLAVHGYAAFPGCRFFTNTSASDHIRVASSGLTPEMVEPLADAIALCFEFT